jgi:hypothetical protein
MKPKKAPRKAQQTKPQAAAQPAHEEIAAFAYFTWERRGCGHGFDLGDWLEAEQQLKATRFQNGGTE